MKLAAVVVHYRTPALAARCVEALRADAVGSALELDIVLVDNGSDAADRPGLAALPVRLVEPGANLGYAGGVNRGIAAATEAAAMSIALHDCYVVLNPDVLVEPGCLAALGDALAKGAGIAGPRLLWDVTSGDLLPPLEPSTRRWELLRRLAERRGGRWARRARRVWRRHALAQWRASEPVSSFALSGALLAFNAAAWRRVGPFDEGYRLYFEETDWLARARRAGVGARHVPAARAVHLYAQSTPHEPRAAAWLAASQQRYRRRHHGRAFDALVTFIDRGDPAPHGAEREAARFEPSPANETWPADSSVRWIETSPSPLGVPAAGRPIPTGLRGDEPLVPPTLEPRLAAGTWWLRAVDEAGRTRHRRRVERSKVPE
ncbi:MAG: glycosyltransferase family 2 protein [Acidobacteriota bacterium]